VQEAIKTRRLTPTHVQVALQMPTPYEAHDALKTAINLEWDSGTLRTYVQNRVEQIEAAKQKAEALGEEPVIPPPNPQELTQYVQCLLCGYKKPREQVTMQYVCDGCRDLVGYITSMLGPSEDAINTVYAALQAYHGRQDVAQKPG
jgi:diphthamide synthase subunit DPH2